MSSMNQNIKLVVDGDAAKGSKAVKTFADGVGNLDNRLDGLTGRFGKLDKQTERTHRSLGGLDDLVSTVSLAGLAYGAFQAVEAFGEVEVSEAKLENTLSNMPQLAGENKDAFLDVASAIEGVTAADGDAVVEGEALLGTFQVTGEQIRNLMPLVVDYARKFGTDLPAASIQIGKALDGQIGALKKNGVSIDEALYKTDRYAAVQKALREQVGGFAEQEAKTASGEIERLQVQMGNLQEKVGGALAPTFSSFIDIASDTVDLLGKVPDGIIPIVGAAAGVALVTPMAAKGLMLVGLEAEVASKRAALMSRSLIILTGAADIVARFQDGYGAAWEKTTKALGQYDKAQSKIVWTHRMLGEATFISSKEIDEYGKKHKTLANTLDNLIFGGFEPENEEIAKTEKAAKKAADGLDTQAAALKRTESTIKSLTEAQRAEVEQGEEATDEQITAYEKKLRKAQETTAGTLKGIGLEKEAMADLTLQIAGSTEEQIKNFDEAYKSYYGWVGLFDEVPKHLATTESGFRELGGNLLQNLKDQVGWFKNWQTDIKGISAKIPPEMEEELRKMGPITDDQIRGLNTLSRKDFEEYVATWKEKHREAAEAAKAELALKTPQLIAEGKVMGQGIIQGIAEAMGLTMPEFEKRVGIVKAKAKEPSKAWNGAAWVTPSLKVDTLQPLTGIQAIKRAWEVEWQPTTKVLTAVIEGKMSIGDVFLGGWGPYQKVAKDSDGAVGFAGRKNKLDGFADGGFSNRPAIFGEAGLEVAIPLSMSKRDRGRSLWIESGLHLGMIDKAPSVSPVTTSASTTTTVSLKGVKIKITDLENGIAEFVDGRIEVAQTRDLELASTLARWQK